ncbi:unnamed protein product [Adineta ricciae]|uniref:DUF4590 domain-containing protein n=1 Tax=Adineta ricciae TaxID=249248 RepID=A0A813P2W6_ADIRI|nr:unnamed protein product [Adineta ricciae]CAF0744496.1 unnamed protein product [Adineta ricciae]
MSGQQQTSNSSSKSAPSSSTDRSARTKQSQTSARSSSSAQSTCKPNVLLNRNVNPKILPPGERCLITMVYIGPELAVEYDREWFEPDGDEIIVMQQHCGGGNLVAFKGFLNHNETFEFESARRTDYPLALTFFINGTVYNRLSVCCESRCHGSMRIGGKHGMFGISKIEKQKPCRRCRYEQRMKMLLEQEERSSKSTRRSAPPTSTAKPKSNTDSKAHKKSPVTATTDGHDSDSTSSADSTPRIASPNSKISDKSKSKFNGTSAPRTDSNTTKTDTPITYHDDFDAPVEDSTDPRSTIHPKKSDISGPNSDSDESNTSNRSPVITHQPRNFRDTNRTPAPDDDDSDTTIQEMSHLRVENQKPQNGISTDSDEFDVSNHEPSHHRTPSPEVTGRPRSRSPSPLREPTSNHQSSNSYSTISSLVQKPRRSNSPVPLFSHDNSHRTTVSSTAADITHHKADGQTSSSMNRVQRRNDASDEDNNDDFHFKLFRIRSYRSVRDHSSIITTKNQGWISSLLHTHSHSYIQLWQNEIGKIEKRIDVQNNSATSLPLDYDYIQDIKDDRPLSYPCSGRECSNTSVTDAESAMEYCILTNIYYDSNLDHYYFDQNRSIN